MQAFQVSTGPAPGPRNYVFVDEHNRHKRLKVMRACEGCRRRKIKCDAATTNTWPCGACRRLKLPCVPPSGGVEGDQVADQVDALSSHDASQSASQQPFSSQYDVYASQYQGPRSHSLSVSTSSYELAASQTIYASSDYPYATSDVQQRMEARPSLHDFRYHSAEHAPLPNAASSPMTPSEQTAESLTDQLGELKIDDAGVAPYIRQQHASAKEPAGPIHETEPELPTLSTIAGSQIRIPPALMPSDEDAAEHFETFFEHVHPYAPVISRSQFYDQWHSDRESMSPLLLEAIFACATRMSGDPVGDSPWLALANKHEASFLDTPRLSTVQALLLLLKAREGSPKRGYFYKSWMTCKTIVSMAKDLELHEHRATHEADEPCDSDPAECLAKTRAWQTIFICEMMIGAPQGRVDMGVDPDTVVYDEDPPGHDLDDYEASISRQFAHFIRNARNIRACLTAYTKLKKKKDWALDPIFEEKAQAFDLWTQELPEDLRIPLSHSGPHLRPISHFIGNMHSHHELGIIMLNRPRLLALKASAEDQLWRDRLSLCYNAAKRLCKIQELIVAQHNITGLLSMQRGMSFTVYAILTCVMLHLVAITSPDPEFNVDAREYFVRHMRLLEKCVPEWPMPETEQQINNLRAAFSANLEKPFDLKASFPYGTPSEASPNARRSSDAHSAGYTHSHDAVEFSQPQWRTQDDSHFPTPPMSIGPNGSLPDTPYSFRDYNTNQSKTQFRQMAPTSYPSADMSMTQQWNPTPIMDQFTTAFAIPPSALESSSSGYGNSPPMSMTSSLPHQPYTPSPQTPTYDHSIYQAHLSKHQLQMPGTSQGLSHTAMTHAPSVQAQFYDPNMSATSASLSQQSLSHAIQQQQAFLTEQMTQPPQNNMNDMNSLHNPSAQPSMVFVSPKEWQQSVARVYDPNGLKRRWDYDVQ